MAIDDRKQRVLRAIVTLYESEGEPVGSGLLAEHFDVPVSSATLRNEMALLTKLGFLEQPHTSAGRVPSAKGYRYYIDNLLDTASQLSSREERYIDDIFDRLDFDSERLVKGAAKALSELSGMAVIATTPKSEDVCIAHFEVIQAGRNTAAVLGVSNTGSVRTRVAKVAFQLNSSDCKTLEDVLNSALTFRASQDVGEEYLRGVSAMMGQGGKLAYPVLLAAQILLKEAGRERVFLEGQQSLLHNSHINDHFATLLDLIDDKQTFDRIIYPSGNRISVILGEDIEQYPMPGLCIVSQRYLAGGGRSGVISVIGSTRMSFMQIIPQIEYFALRLGQSITGG